MKLQVTQLASSHHTEMVPAVAWTPQGELYACSEDKEISRWSMDGELLGKAGELDAVVTDMHWFPSVGAQAADTFALACTDGTFRVVNRAGREEKRTEAHHGAVITLRWNYDGSALATGGEDGTVKIWSRSAMLRSTLAATSHPVYTVAWGPDNDMLLFSSGRELMVKSVQVDRSQLKWTAHEGVVMQADWNPVNSLIVSAGEDCKFKVWDSFGRQLFQSRPLEHVITSVAWCPNGQLFAVGAFNTLRLCDKTGWTYSRERTKSGSLYRLSWSMDGTQVAAGGGNGAVVFGQLVQRHLEWENCEATLVNGRQIRVRDVLHETAEELDFRDRVIEMSLGFGHLVVATATQCAVYNVSNWHTPHIFDLRDTCTLIVQSARHFALVGGAMGVQIYSYEGRLKSAPKFSGLRVEFLNWRTLSLANDCVAILDRSDNKTVRFFDTETGRPLGQPIQHSMELVEVALSKSATPANDRRIVLLDRNQDLYIAPLHKRQLFKLHNMVDSVAWNDQCDVLVAMADGNMVVWYYPNAAFVDPDLLSTARITKRAAEFGKLPLITHFFGTRLVIRRADGSLLTAAVSPFPAVLYTCADGARWDDAVRLCRFVKENELWACLAGLALAGRHLDTAEVALAAINEVSKLQYIRHIKDIPSGEARSAELALFRRSPEEAEQILLQASPPLIYRAIKLNIRLYRWERALELAMTHRTHVDTVLAYRQRFLQSAGRQEADAKFLQVGREVQVDWDAVQAKKRQEKERELERAGAAGTRATAGK